jgi:hypothetical protein
MRCAHLRFGTLVTINSGVSMSAHGRATVRITSENGRDGVHVALMDARNVSRPLKRRFSVSMSPFHPVLRADLVLLRCAHLRFGALVTIDSGWPGFIACDHRTIALTAFLKTRPLSAGPTPAIHQPSKWVQITLFSSLGLKRSSPKSGDLCYKSGSSTETGRSRSCT